ncbi:MAG: MazG nucleotide pyrophosphohydrolase domain-containing protein [Spirochaetales bacterium]|nr:MazG nucleotide pyrophosphohydrolase domain-containing protein [Spirochaetales bacterium]
MKHLDDLLLIAKRKNLFDQTSTWAEGSKTYLAEIKKELVEVEEELLLNRNNYLEDELGDVLWDYLNILLTLEEERGITVESVLKRACRKYEERISGIESGHSWNSVKEKQKTTLKKEFDQE